MSKKNNVRFNWHCPHCQNRNVVSFSHQWQIEMPNNYSVIWECNNCGKESKLEWSLSVWGGWDNKKKPKLRRRRKEEKKRRKKAEIDYEAEHGVNTQRNGGYRNDKAKQKV